MKKWVLAILIAGVLAALCACGSDTGKKEETTTAAQTTEAVQETEAKEEETTEAETTEAETTEAETTEAVQETEAEEGQAEAEENAASQYPPVENEVTVSIEGQEVPVTMLIEGLNFTATYEFNGATIEAKGSMDPADNFSLKLESYTPEQIPEQYVQGTLDLVQEAFQAQSN